MQQSVPVVIARTRYIDDFVLKQYASGVRQFVILGAGMDARAFRLPGISAARYSLLATNNFMSTALTTASSLLLLPQLL